MLRPHLHQSLILTSLVPYKISQYSTCLIHAYNIIVCLPLGTKYLVVGPIIQGKCKAANLCLTTTIIATMNTHLNLCIMFGLCTAILTQPLFKPWHTCLCAKIILIIKQFLISLLPNDLFFILVCHGDYFTSTCQWLSYRRIMVVFDSDQIGVLEQLTGVAWQERGKSDPERLCHQCLTTS